MVRVTLEGGEVVIVDANSVNVAPDGSLIAVHMTAGEETRDLRTGQLQREIINSIAGMWRRDLWRHVESCEIETGEEEETSSPLLLGVVK